MSLGRAYGLYTGGFLGFVVVLALLEQLGVGHAVIGYLFIIFTLASYAVIGVMSRTMLISEFFVAGRRVPALQNGMAAAANWISGGIFVGLVGALYAHGYDGMAFVLGGTGGYVLIAVLIAPYLRKFGAYTVPDFLAARFGGNLVRFLGILVLLCASFTFFVAEISLTGIIASRFLGIDFGGAVYTGLAVILLCSLLGGMRAVTWTQVAQYIVVIVAFLVPVTLLSWQRYGIPIPQLAYGQALQEIAILEEPIRGAELDATAALTAHVQPFATYDPFNFFALILTLMVGTASLPHVLMRYFTTPSVRAARQSVGWSLLFIFILYFTAPAYAAFAKLEVFQNVIGQSVDALPSWIYTYGQSGLVKICGVDATAVETIKTACAAAGNPDGLLGFGELKIDNDVIVLATPEIAGLPYVIAGLVAAGGVAAALSTANGLLLAIANALSHDVYFRMVDPKAPTGRRLIVARVLLVGMAAFAAYVASTRPGDILSMVSWAFSLSAAGNFPALVLGIWWKRCTTAGAIAGILAGFGVTLFYLLMTRYGGMPEWPIPGLTGGVRDISAAIFGLPVGFIVMIVVSLMTPEPPKEMQDFIEVRRPRGETVVKEKAA